MSKGEKEQLIASLRCLLSALERGSLNEVSLRNDDPCINARNRDDDYLNEHQTAAAFSFSIAWLRAKRLKGADSSGDAGPPYHKIGTKIRYRRGDVRAYLEAHKVDRSKKSAGAK